MQHLPYVAALGVDAIWVSPFFRSPMKDFGYDVADYRAVDPIFGTLADFDRLLARAHQLGLKVMIDQVLSHTSDQHAWFAQSRASRRNPRADWYVWADPRPDGTPPNNWLSVFGGSAWTWDARRRQYYLHSFLAEQPDLNFHHRPVQDALLEEVAFWCARGVDGFRFDACNHQFHDRRLRSNPPARRGGAVSTVQADNPYALQQHRFDKSQPDNLAFLQRLRRVLDRHGAASIGEVGDEQPAPLMARYTEAGKRLHMAYSFSLVTREGSAEHIRREVQTLERALARTGGWGCWAMSNHDSVRVATRWSARGQRDAAQVKMLQALLVSLRGSACVYQGEELGLPEADVPFEHLQDPYGRAFWPEFKGRDGCRTPMPWQAARPHAGFSTARRGQPWLPLSPAHAPLAVDPPLADADSPLHWLRRMLAWRRGQSALRLGDIRFLDAPPHVLLFERRLAAQRRLCAFNLGPRRVAVPIPAGFTVDEAAPLQAATWSARQLRLGRYGVAFGRQADAA